MKWDSSSTSKGARGREGGAADVEGEGEELREARCEGAEVDEGNEYFSSLEGCLHDSH